MNPVVLPMLHLPMLYLPMLRRPMLHLLCIGHGRKGVSGDVGMLGTRNSQNALVFVRKYLDETRESLMPVVENPLRAAASRQFEVPGYEAVNKLQILRFDQGLQIDGFQVAALLGEISTLIENIGEATA